ncbi:MULTISPECIES: ATP cone domain-containing protein [Methanobacterium]|uniref:ATP-cone domain-containing protein n=1 Tax=Methanobacterium bryantii TaxID=2161 RepID=A0A2A2H1S7_METBR|nr:MULTISPECIES: ATP cone domain-containing protein [Methanobacterium]OEC87949.1 hypothetical protein A9507_06420 [Methanobacterium sp. A39]PAV03339.1 hypothetical protein ASJ80_04910 [Methanobacterium bryantii]
MKDMRAMAALPTQAKTCVLKNNGIYEEFNPKKIIKSCLNVGVPRWIAEQISIDILKKLKKLNLDYVSTTLIHEIVSISIRAYGFEFLEQENNEYEFDSSETHLKFFISGNNPGIGWYRCIECDNYVFISKNRDILTNCTVCDGYQFRLI